MVRLHPTPAPRSRRRVFAWLVAVLAVVLQFGSSLHGILVAHVVCPEHGELTHAGSAHAESAHAESAHAESAHAESAHAESAHVGSAHADWARAPHAWAESGDPSADAAPALAADADGDDHEHEHCLAHLARAGLVKVSRGVALEPGTRPRAVESPRQVLPPVELAALRSSDRLLLDAPKNSPPTGVDPSNRSDC